MGTLYELVDLDTNLKREIIGAERCYYYDPVIGFAPVFSSICYCFNCEEFSSCEFISRKHIDGGNDDDYGDMRYSILMSNYRKILAHRISKPKCLSCGSDRIQDIPANTPTLISGLGKRVELIMIGMAAKRYAYRFFNAEGLVIMNQDSDALRKALFSF